MKYTKQIFYFMFFILLLCTKSIFVHTYATSQLQGKGRRDPIPMPTVPIPIPTIQIPIPTDRPTWFPITDPANSSADNKIESMCLQQSEKLCTRLQEEKIGSVDKNTLATELKAYSFQNPHLAITDAQIDIDTDLLQTLYGIKLSKSQIKINGKTVYLYDEQLNEDTIKRILNKMYPKINVVRNQDPNCPTCSGYAVQPISSLPAISYSSFSKDGSTSPALSCCLKSDKDYKLYDIYVNPALENISAKDSCCTVIHAKYISIHKLTLMDRIENFLRNKFENQPTKSANKVSVTSVGAFKTPARCRYEISNFVGEYTKQPRTCEKVLVTITLIPKENTNGNGMYLDVNIDLSTKFGTGNPIDCSGGEYNEKALDLYTPANLLSEEIKLNVIDKYPSFLESELKIF